MPDCIATVVATFSRRMRLQLPDGTELDARIKGRKLRPVCGDRVAVQRLEQEDDWLITGIEERDNALTRPNRRGEREILAANFDVLLVVTAPEPKPDWFIVDRYLCAAENAPADAAVVFNKSDLGVTPDIDEALSVYTSIGYEVATCSAVHADGIAGFEALIRGRTALVVGQSGVGKSSLINLLVGDERQRIASISGKTGEGRHTTVNSAMYAVGDGGHVIDSPGVRDYAPALETEQQVATGFREIRQAAPECRFANCRHLREPGCAVIARLDNAVLDERRYESYRRCIRLLDRLGTGRFYKT